MFLAKGLSRNCKVDLFESGCQLGIGDVIRWDMVFTAKSLEELKVMLADYHDTEKDNIFFENGLLHVSMNEILTYDTWLPLTSLDYHNWKNGADNIYLVDYTYKVYESISCD